MAAKGIQSSLIHPLSAPLPPPPTPQSPPPLATTARVTLTLPSARFTKVSLRWGDAQSNGSNVVSITVPAGESVVDLTVPPPPPLSTTSLGVIQPSDESRNILVKLFISSGKKWVLLPYSFLYYDPASLSVTLWPRTGSRPSALPSSSSSPPPPPPRFVHPSSFYALPNPDLAGTRVFLLEPTIIALLPILANSLKVKFSFQQQRASGGRTSTALNGTSSQVSNLNASSSSLGGSTRPGSSSSSFRRAAIILDVHVLVSSDADPATLDADLSNAQANGLPSPPPWAFSGELSASAPTLAASLSSAESATLSLLVSTSSLPFVIVPPDIRSGTHTVALSLDAGQTWSNLEDSFLVYDTGSLADASFLPTTSWAHDSTTATFGANLLKRAMYRFQANPIVAFGTPPSPVPAPVIRARLIPEFLSSLATADAALQTLAQQATTTLPSSTTASTTNTTTNTTTTNTTTNTTTTTTTSARPPKRTPRSAVSIPVGGHVRSCRRNSMNAALARDHLCRKGASGSGGILTKKKYRGRRGGGD